MESLLQMAKAIPADSWLVMSLLASAVVVGLHSVYAHFVGPEASPEDADMDGDR
ncbi:hypothetical protein [Mycolicibacterium sp. CH28]|uniref:hypothetical protein n=1 Tax=Mycolicibacterium sp. CH28 TaxID=2512237 RepID=UPI0013867409|nr:hypothetical protein [Mycolicibacterium sp. CH28]